MNIHKSLSQWIHSCSFKHGWCFSYLKCISLLWNLFVLLCVRNTESYKRETILNRIFGKLSRSNDNKRFALFSGMFQSQKKTSLKKCLLYMSLVASYHKPVIHIDKFKKSFSVNITMNFQRNAWLSGSTNIYNNYT